MYFKCQMMYEARWGENAGDPRMDKRCSLSRTAPAFSWSPAAVTLTRECASAIIAHQISMESFQKKQQRGPTQPTSLWALGPSELCESLLAADAMAVLAR